MHEYLLDTELVRFAFVLGIVVAIFLYDRLHLSTGSVVVPGYIGVCILTPALILGTLASSFLVYFVVHRVLPKFVLMTKSGKFLAAILVSVALQAALFELRRVPDLPTSASFLMGGLGYLIPGLVAHDMVRQGIKRTMAALAGTGAIVVAGVLFFVFVSPDLARPGHQGAVAALSFDPRWMPFALLLSALASCALREKHGLRSGGFMGAAYLSLILVQPAQVACFVALTTLTYLLVTRILMKWVILFGRRKYASMLLVGTVLSWGALLLTRGSGILGAQASSSVALTLAGVVLSGLFANDLERVGPLRVIEGGVLSVLFTLSGTLAVAELAAQRRIEVVLAWVGIALLSGTVILRPYLGPALRAMWAGRVLPGSLSGRIPVAAGISPRRGGVPWGSFRLAGATLILAVAAGVGFTAWRSEAALFRSAAASRAELPVISYFPPAAAAPAPDKPPFVVANARSNRGSADSLVVLEVANRTDARNAQ